MNEVATTLPSYPITLESLALLLVEMRGHFETQNAELRGQFATQNAQLRGHIDQQITQLRSDLEKQIQASRSETTLLLGNLRQEMMQQGAVIRADLAKDFSALQDRMTQWVREQRSWRSQKMQLGLLAATVGLSLVGLLRG